MGKKGLSVVDLQEIVASSVEQALEMSRLEDEAEREKVRQARLEDEIDKKAGAGKDHHHGSLKAEEPGVDAPTRDKTLDMPGRKPAPEEPEPEQGSDDQPEKEDIDADAVIDKFNIIRSGRSMNDRDISTALSKYVNSLRPDVRTTVFGVMQKIAQLVAPTVDSSRLTKPPEEPSAVQNARLQMLQKHRKDREAAADKHAADVASSTVDTSAPVRGPEPPPEEEVEKDDVEDTSPPIRVGKRTAEGLRVRMKQLLQD